MSQDDGKKPPGKGKNNRFRIVGTAEGAKPIKPSLEAIEQMFMASPYVEWSPFAKSNGWDAAKSRTGLPVADWAERKRGIIAISQAEVIADAVFHHRSKWHEDVLNTLREYPEANDAMLGILKKRLNHVIEAINLDAEEAHLAKIRNEEAPTSRFGLIKNSELAALAGAIKTATESKHRSLMIHDWSFKVAETFSDPKQFTKAEERIADQEWKVEIKGGENLTSADMQKLITQWYDAPPPLHTPEEIAVAAGEER